MIDININDLIGKPFKVGGRGPDYYDCWGIVVECYKRLGSIVPDFSMSGPVCLSYHKKTSEIIENEIQKDVWEELDKPEEPCVVIFKEHPYFTQHIGMYLGYGKYIHISKNIGVEIDRLDNPIKKQKIRGYYKYVTRNNEG